VKINSEADANAMRYVWPWLRAQEVIVSIVSDLNCNVAVLLDGLYAVTGDHFGPTLCRTALDAWRAGK
jgi:hypothetical protein